MACVGSRFVRKNFWNEHFVPAANLEALIQLIQYGFFVTCIAHYGDGVFFCYCALLYLWLWL